jgi:diguanylate cyclase (GGDEF)-like protein
MDPGSSKADAQGLDLAEELRQREYEIELLKDTAVAVVSELDLDKLMRLVAERARELIRAETVLIPILNEQLNEYTYRAGAGIHADEIVGESLPIDFGVCGWVWRHKKPWWRGVLDELTPQERNQWEKEAGTLLMVPLVGRQHFLGGIAGLNKQGGGDFSKRDLDLLELFAGQVAIAIENAMAMRHVEAARQAAEDYQRELQRLNKRLSAVNRELEYLSLNDHLTGLPNRSLFMDRVERELAISAVGGSDFAVLLIDLDRFQDVNDSLGHEAGDALLKQVTERLRGVVGHGDTLSRMGGDEFAILLHTSGIERALAVARQLHDLLSQPFPLAGERLVVSASIGIAHYPSHGANVSTLLKRADVAMYAAKHDRQGTCVYQEGLDQFSSGRLALVSDLRLALDRGEFRLHYQPKVSLVTRGVVGAEALARWPHAEKGYISPEIFINALEQTGLIYPFSYWVMDTALAQCAAWRAAGWPLKVAVNVPIMVLNESRFVDELRLLLKRHRIEDGLLIEVTESVFMSDYENLVLMLRDIRQYGVSLSIDDFGTGHSSLSRLRKLPVSELKIDRSFVSDMDRNKDDRVIVKSTIDMARNLGLEVVAEGVERAAVIDDLARMHCHMAQGYHISPALPVDEFARFLQESDWKAA